MTPQQVAMVSTTERRIADRFEQLGIAEPAESAKRLVDDLVRAGWRPWPALTDKAPPRATAPSAVAQAAIAEARAVVDSKRGSRPELEVDR